jgi:elongator complex protein 1
MAEYCLTTARGTLQPPNDFGAIAVIDGSAVKITPLRTANMPPPMSMFDLTVQGTTLDVAFLADDSIIVILHTLGVDIYTWKAGDGPRLAPTLFLKTELPKSDLGMEARPLQVFPSGANEFCVLVMSFETTLYPATLDISSRSMKWRDGINIAGTWSMASVTEGYVGKDGKTAGYVHSHTSKDMRILDGACSEDLPFKIPYFAPWVEVIPWGSSEVAFALSRTGQLAANSRILAKNCTSFLVTREHLIFTTNNHLLKFVHIDISDEMGIPGVEGLEVPTDDPESDERCRSVERGARLVTATPTNMSLVLQMPRGNTETIFPRAMVLAGIRKLLDENNYKRAFAYCRTQRVDMNLLYDHQPAQFLGNVALFLEQLEDVTYVDLFLSSLR